ncbi:MAG: pyruvate dehydrogenase complex dihydrolipoamide acetyltransferase, partial [Kiloniellales bacterium]
MPIKVLMPALSPTMTEGKVASWHKKEGDRVGAGDVLAEIETDKATMELEAVDEGVLSKIVVPEGTEAVPVSEVIALILEDGEDASAIEAALESSAEPAARPAAAEPAPKPAAAEPASEPAAAPAVLPPRDADGRLFASPLARRMAKQAGIALESIKGSGPHGRVVKSDVEAAIAGGVAEARPAVEAPAAAPAAPFEPAFELKPLSSMRKTIARRLSESKQTVPHFYLPVDCEIDRLLELRKDLNSRAEEDVKLSINDLIIKAAALALMAVPKANASWSDDGIKQYKSADIAVAVALEDGLITPVIRGAQDKGLAAISREMKGLAARARDGKLMPEDYQGGTFSLSNLGMFGIKDFAAVINPPQGCILAVGVGEPRPVVRDGALATATVMSCTLSVDH